MPVDEFWRLWPERVDANLSDGDATAWLARVEHDMAGFAGCEAIRRIVGFAKVSDLESLDADQRVVAALAVLERAESLLDRSGDGRFS